MNCNDITVTFCTLVSTPDTSTIDDWMEITLDKFLVMLLVVRQLTAIPVVERHYSHGMLPPEYSAR